MGKKILALHILLGALTLSYGTTNNTESSTSVTASVSAVSKRIITKTFRRVNSTSFNVNDTTDVLPVTEEIPVTFSNIEKIEKLETRPVEETDEIVKPQKLKKKILASNLKNGNDKIILPNDKPEKHNILKPIITTTEKNFFKTDNFESSSNETIKETPLKQDKDNKFLRLGKNQTVVNVEIIKNNDSSSVGTIEPKLFEENGSNENGKVKIKKVIKIPSVIMERTTNVYLGENFEKLQNLNSSKKFNDSVSRVNKTTPAAILSGKKLTLIPRDNIRKNSIVFNNDFNGPNQTDWVPIIPNYQIVRPSSTDTNFFGNKLKLIPAARLNRTTERQPIVFPSNESQNFQTQTESNVISFQDANAKKTVVRHKNNIEKPSPSTSDEMKILTTQSQTGRLPIKFRGAVKYKSNQNQTNQNLSEEDKKSQNETILKKGNFSLETIDEDTAAGGSVLELPFVKNAPTTKTTNILPNTTEISVVVIKSTSNSTTKKSSNSIDDVLIIPPEHLKFENVSKKQEQSLTNNILNSGNKNLTPVDHNASEPSESNIQESMTTMRNPDFANLTEVIFPGSVSKNEENKTISEFKILKTVGSEVETTSVDATSEGLVTSPSTSELHTSQGNFTFTTENIKHLGVSSQSSISDSSIEKIMGIPNKMKIIDNDQRVKDYNFSTLTSTDYISTTSIKGTTIFTTLKPSSFEEVDNEDGQSNIEVEPTTTIKTTVRRVDEVKNAFKNSNTLSTLSASTTTNNPFQYTNGTVLKSTSTTTSNSHKNFTKFMLTTPLTVFKHENSTQSTFSHESTISSKKQGNTPNIDIEATSTISNAILDKALTDQPLITKTTKKFDITSSATSTTSIPHYFTLIKKLSTTTVSSTSTTSHKIPTTSSTTEKLPAVFPVTSRTLVPLITSSTKPSSPTTPIITTTTTTNIPPIAINSYDKDVNTDRPQKGIHYEDYIPPTLNPHIEITEENVPAYLRLTVEAVSWAELCNLKEDLHDAIIRMLGGSSNVSSESVHFLNLNDKNCQEKIEKVKNQETNQTVFLPVNMFLMDNKGDFDKNLSEAFLTSWGRQGLDFELPIRKVDFVTPIVNLTELPEPPLGGSVVAAIIISCVAGLCVILLGVLFVIMKRRQKRFNYGQRCTPVSLDAYSLDSVSIYNSVRRKGMRASKRSYGNAAFDDPEVPTHPMNFAGLANFSSDKEQLYEEFNIIPQVSPKVEELPEGAEAKNRYANVIPLPETRVHLSKRDGDPLSDYINANYIRGPKGMEKLYIACQAPMESTIQDFWRMIWEEQCKVILMITDLQENGIEKCADYLPPNEVTDNLRLFGDFQVTLKKRDVKEKYIISHLKLKNLEANLWREVVHLWYLGWPDQGVPTEASSIIAFLIEARSQLKIQNGATTSSPTVVHCSPGTGRTGTVIACDLCIREYEHSRLVDIPKCVYNLRRDRAGSVQTKDQYAFIYQVLNVYATKLSGGGIESI